MRFRLAVALCCLGVPSSIGLQTSGNELCSWQSKTPPDALPGNEGHSSDDAYWFSHLSDVDKENQTYHYVFPITNHHPKNYLPVEWLRSDGTVQVQFKRIAPDGCGGNDFTTSLVYQEDPKGTINYGPLKQNPKVAPLYVMTKSNQDQRATGPKLSSRTFADLQDDNGKPYRLFLEFRTEFEGPQFTYTVSNHGARTASFAMPTFSEALRNLEKVPGLAYVSRWNSKDSKDDVFIVEPGKTEKQVIRVKAFREIEEKLVQLSILSDGEPLATGQVIVYLPVQVPEKK
jgi:hypothetical protein